MAIKDGRQHPQVERSGEEVETQAGKEAGIPNMQPGAWSFHQGNRFQRPIAAGAGSEVYLKLRDTMKEIMEEAEGGDNRPIEFKLIELAREQHPRLNYSSLVLVGKLPGTDKAGYHIILVEPTGEPLADIEQTINNRTYKAPRVSGMAVNEVLIGLAESYIRGNDKTITGVDYCASTVVNSQLDPSDKNQVRTLLSNCGLALFTNLGQRYGGIGDIDLTTMEKESLNVIEVGFDRVVGKDAVGNPVRSDTCVRWVSTRPGSRDEKQQLNTGNNDVTVTEVSGFIDFLYTAPHQATPFMQYQQMNGPIPTQKFAARLVLTDIYSDWALSPSAILLALSSTSALVQENNWYQAFRPRMRDTGSVDMADIGALNIEGNLGNPMAPPGTFGQAIDTHDQAFDLPALGQLLTGLVQPGLTVALDCPRNGPQSWFTQMFAKAATGPSVAGGAEANAAITRHGNQLTGGLFSKRFQELVQQGHSPNYFARTPEVVLNGNWTEANGTVRSINDFDYLAYANLVGERDPAQLRDWTDLFARTDISTAQRLDTFRRVLSQLTSGRFQITDVSNRVTFTSTFLTALYTSVRDTGIPIQVKTPMDPDDFNNQRSYAGFASAALVAPTLQMSNQIGNVGGGYWNPYGPVYR